MWIALYKMLLPSEELKISSLGSVKVSPGIKPNIEAGRKYIDKQSCLMM
jgi:hypothetical protein